MSRPTTKETHLRNFMLFLFDQGIKTNEAMKKITDTYREIIKLNKCNWWFNQFKNGNKDIKVVTRKGRPLKLNDAILESMVTSDSRQTFEELSLKIGCPWSTGPSSSYRKIE